jgi:Docking domain of Afi1 for Arf3 in vesicle trafficking
MDTLPSFSASASGSASGFGSASGVLHGNTSSPNRRESVPVLQRGTLGHLGIGGHVCYVLLAEFDIDKGSVLKHEFPRSTGVEHSFLAEKMLPEGAHLRETDFTVFHVEQKVCHVMSSLLFSSLLFSSLSGSRLFVLSTGSQTVVSYVSMLSLVLNSLCSD